MRLYHCFPRRAAASPCISGDWQLGHAMLSCILRSGLLLTSEELTIPPNRDSDIPNPPSTEVTQYRACFSLNDENAVLSTGGLSDHFGEFAIALDSLHARTLGIVPTIYYYKTENEDPDSSPDSGVSAEILNRLAEVRRILIAIAHVETKAFPQKKERYRDKSYLAKHGLTLEDESAVWRSLHALTQSDARHMYDCLNNERVAAWNLAEWIEMTLSMFQTADSKVRNRHLAYFSQREWRVIQHFSETINCWPLDRQVRQEFDSFAQRALTSAESQILRINEEFGVEIPANDCFLLHSAQGIKFRHFVQEVICPTKHANNTEKILTSLSIEATVRCVGDYSVFSTSS